MLCLGWLQLQGFNGRPVLYKSLGDCFVQMLRNEGPRSFYRGMLCSYLKVCLQPTCLCTWDLDTTCSGTGHLQWHAHAKCHGAVLVVDSHWAFI